MDQGTIATTILGGIGGLAYLVIRAKVSARNESRKEDRATIDSIARLVDEVEASCYQYYCLPAQDPKALEISQKIKALIQQVARKTNTFSQRNEEAKLSTPMVKFRQVVTLPMDDVNRERRHRNDPIFDDITAAGRRIVDELERIFSSTYR